MKRTLLIVALVLLITTSLIAGTLSAYSITIDDLAAGSVVAKEFILKPGETNTFEENIKIAPGDTVEWKFSVKNYEETLVSETAMDLEFAVTLAAAEGKDAIEPLVVSVTDEEDQSINLDDDGKFTDEFPLAETGQEKTYNVKIEWPLGTDEIPEGQTMSEDAQYAGADYGSAVTVSVTGTQQEATDED